MITDPLYFNQRMKWQDRRKMLIDICGDVSDSVVIVNNSVLEPLNKYLGTKSVDDLRLQLKSQMKPINDELKEIPIKINEANLAIPKETCEVDEIAVSNINADITALESKKASIVNGGAIAEKEAELIKQRNRKLLIQNEIPETKKFQNELIELNRQKGKLEIDIEREETNIQTKKSMQNSNELKRDELRKEYVETNAMKYDETENICPACGQQLPPEKIAKAVEEFNVYKSTELEKINKDGMSLKAEFETRADEITILSNDVELKKRGLEDLKKQIAEKEAQIDSLESNFRLKQQPKLDKCDEAIIQIEREIDSLKIDAGAAITEIGKQIDELKNQRAVYDNIKAQERVAETQKARIAELEAREKELAAEYSSKEELLYLTDSFIKAKVEMLTENINSHFKLCKFKMFNQNINGGIEECCEVTVDGVNYADLNNAMKINAGLDCINTICNFTQSYAPIFIDNAESVNKTLETKSQQIRLYVTETDETLRIENK